MTVFAAVACAALAGAVLAGRPSPLRTRLGPRSGIGDMSGGPRHPDGFVTSDDDRLGVLRRVIARLRASRRSEGRENDVSEICLALSAELQSGVPMGKAVTEVAADWPDLLGEVAGQVAVGGEVAEAFRRVAELPGAGALNAVAAAWDVAERTGAPLSRVLLAVADSLRMAVTARREAQSQLATARATARLMAVLPFGTLLLLSSGDRAAVRFLFTTPVGWVCLGIAGSLAALGMWWVDRVSRTTSATVWTP